MNEKILKIAKVVVPVISVGVTLAANYLSNKELDEKVAKKVSETLAKVNEEAESSLFCFFFKNERRKGK